MDCDSIPELCGGIFNSTKQKKGSFIGKYGIGLKAIMLYYQTTLNVSSSTIEEAFITSYQVFSLSLAHSSYPWKTIVWWCSANPKPRNPSLSNRISVEPKFESQESLGTSQNCGTGAKSRTCERLTSRYVQYLRFINLPCSLSIDIEGHPSLHHVSFQNVNYALELDFALRSRRRSLEPSDFTASRNSLPHLLWKRIIHPSRLIGVFARLSSFCPAGSKEQSSFHGFDSSICKLVLIGTSLDS